MTNATPSPEHTKYLPLVEPYFEKVKAQEAQLLAAGLPAEGLTEFLRRWKDGWMRQDADALVACVTPRLVYADTTTFGADRDIDREELREFLRIGYEMSPDSAFYPQDGTARALPYYDFLDDVRVTVPWRWIGRFSGPARSVDPAFDFGTIAPTNRTFNVIGVDRYILQRDKKHGWQISRIDTDWDMVNLGRQLLPLPMPPERLIKVVTGVQRAVMPRLLRLTDRRAA